MEDYKQSQKGKIRKSFPILHNWGIKRKVERRREGTEGELNSMYIGNYQWTTRNNAMYKLGIPKMWYNLIMCCEFCGGTVIGATAVIIKEKIDDQYYLFVKCLICERELRKVVSVNETNGAINFQNICDSFLMTICSRKYV